MNRLSSQHWRLFTQAADGWIAFLLCSGCLTNELIKAPQIHLGLSMTSQSVALASEKQIYINQLSEHVGSEVILKGWLYNMRSSGKIAFPQLRDGTGVVQCVAVKSAISRRSLGCAQGFGSGVGNSY